MKQEIAFKILTSGANVFLTGSAGTGKTFVINRYIEYLRERGIEPAIVAPTGIAASHIGGKTIHSFFSVGIRENIDDYYLRWMKKQLFLERRFRDLKVLIVDEISMVSPELFMSMDRILRAFKDEEKFFGGVQVVLAGDFFQLPPVNKRHQEIKFVWQTNLWQAMDLKICYLEEKFRQENDILADILDEIRAGEVTEESMEIFRSRYKKNLSSGFNITKLYTHNIDVDKINNGELEKLPGKSIVFKSQTKGSKQNIERIFKGSLVQEELKLKEGAAVIFIKNNYEEGYINGTLGKIESFDSESGYPIVRTFDKRKITVSPEEWVWEDDEGKIKARVKQIPLKLAWALTVHKSQGMTLDAAEIDLSKTFEIGQGYVALSRIKSIESLRLMGMNEVALRVDESVLEMDRGIKIESRINFGEFQEIDELIIKKISEEFILKLGGEIVPEKIKEIKKERELGKINKKDRTDRKNTLDITKEMIEAKKTIGEIIETRGLSYGTVIDHLLKLKKMFPEINLKYLKPKGENLKRVLKEADKIRKENRSDNFTAEGELKLKPIFEALGKKVSYDEIKLCMIFEDK